jgi:thiosulfate/3-mercaptopyruvate sulfurtransferase
MVDATLARYPRRGFKQWRLKDQPIESGSVAPIPGAELTIRVDPKAWMSRAGVEAVVRGEEAGTLICALSQELFNGTAPTRYRRRGHIPGSRNFPARELFESEGMYLRPADLAPRAAPALAGAARPLIRSVGWCKPMPVGAEPIRRPKIPCKSLMIQ